ncbi:hypothetical protein ONE63_008074 [Megalurothrips usitatus]|uniref:DNA-directed DNA polymerase n=1 Tax=Megalurothrips usitatus TaxID=439358 RepID=A0AAV7XT03_9NEOP|nr:hypothetical protein ONE63_008074 [Megalurothrips usitatus]
MCAFRRNFLREGTIGIVPQGGYHGLGKQSYIAMHKAFRLGQKIHTIFTDRGETSVNRYEQTVKLTSLFRRSGYTVTEKWECEWKREMSSDPDVMEYFQAHPTTRVHPLNLRDALCGGRTSALRCYHKADVEKGEKIKMVDVTSEYPNANLRGEYCFGHPEIYMENDPNMPKMADWYGMVKCTVLPPRDLFIPVLPYKINEKLMFPLCRSLARLSPRNYVSLMILVSAN